MSDHNFFRTRRGWLVIGVVAVAALVGAALWWVFGSLPPSTVVMTTGAEGSAYFEVGQRYREILGREGIDLQLLPSNGDVENLARLRDPKSGVGIGFAQGGLTSEKESPQLLSLGTLFLQPLWIFHRGERPADRLAVLRGRRISIGPEGSGTRALSLELLARNGMDARSAELLSLTPKPAGESLLKGEIDAAIMLTGWDSPVVEQLIVADGIALAGFPRADAYVALYPFLTKIMLPTGVADLAKNRPPNDVALLAVKASLVVRRDLHPAIQYALLNAATQIHSQPGIFQKAGEFPAAESIDLPLSDEARQFYKSGRRPFFQRHFPFRLAVLLDRLVVLLIPLVGILYPLLRVLPGLYAWSARQRIFRLYGELSFLEDQLEGRRGGTSLADLSERLKQVEDRTGRIWAPMPLSPMLFTLKDHIAAMRRRLEGR